MIYLLIFSLKLYHLNRDNRHKKYDFVFLHTFLLIHAFGFKNWIRMISEGSCDTEDWSNDAENTALHHRK